MKLTWKPIDTENYADALKLKLLPGQEAYVTPPVESLAMAYVFYNQSMPLGLYFGEKMVGYAMVFYDKDTFAYSICHFSIDAAEQGKGFGKEALGQILLYIAEKPLGDANRISISCAVKNAVMIKICKEYGFELTDSRDEMFVDLSMPINAVKAVDRQTLSDNDLLSVTGGVSDSTHSTRTKTGDTRQQLTAEQLSPAYIHRQIFGKKFDELYGN